MGDEAGGKETAPKISTESLPPALAKEYLAGTLALGKPVSFEAGSVRFFRCAERKEFLSGVGDVTLLVDFYKAPSNKHPDVCDQIYFRYMTVLPGQKEEIQVATITLNLVGPNEVNVYDRKVNPPFERNRGVGSRLLHQAEDWVRQVATELDAPITMVAGASQLDVLKWLYKWDYRPAEEGDAALYQDVMANPNNYEVLPEERGGLSFLIFKLDERGRRNAQPIRINLKKIIEPAGGTSSLRAR